ncbi:TPA: hypothetical protein LR665_004249 [Enterobacter hormaechei]|nr:hypothetical protein [Enterobacter hormaechei]
MNTEDKIQFLERIIPISRFYTKSYISDKTSKLLWIFFTLNSIYILLFTKTITIKELSIYIFSIEINPKQLITLISISALAILIKATLSIRSDLKNNRYEFDLNSYKFSILNREMSDAHTQLMHQTALNFNLMNERGDRLSQLYIKALAKKAHYDLMQPISPQDKEIRAFYNAKYKFIEAILQTKNKKDAKMVEEIKRQTRISSSNIESLFLVVKSYKRQWWITTVINFAPPLLAVLYTLYINFESSLFNLFKNIILPL